LKRATVRWLKADAISAARISASSCVSGSGLTSVAMPWILWAPWAGASATETGLKSTSCSGE